MQLTTTDTDTDIAALSLNKRNQDLREVRRLANTVYFQHDI